MNSSSGCRYDNECVKLNILHIEGRISIFSCMFSSVYTNLLFFQAFLLVAILAYSELVCLWSCALQKLVLHSAGTQRLPPRPLFLFSPHFSDV